MNYNKFKNIYVYLYIHKRAAAAAAGAGGGPYEWQAANASHEPRVLFNLILMQ